MTLSTDNSGIQEKPGVSPAVSNSPVTVPLAQEDKAIEAGNEFRRDLRFWLIFTALCCCSLLSALDLGGIGTAAPTIVHDLNGHNFTWVASAYALSSSACIPLSGNLAQIFGRKPIILSGIVIFALGSAISGSAPFLTVLIVGRAIQGVGAGTMLAMNSVIITDLVPLRERGAYAGITGMIWTSGSAAGPFIAGGLSERASWRWLFYLNLPLAGLAFMAVTIFLRLKRPEGGFGQKLREVDWVGNFLVVASTCSCMLALTLGGVHFPWSSGRVLAPLIIGIAGLICTMIYESRWPKRPVIPIVVLSNRTSLSGYIATFIQGMVTLSMAFFLPTWFQAVKAASPLQSGLYILPLAATLSPFAIVQGMIVSKTGYYRAVIFVGWIAMILGVGLLISVDPGTSIGLFVLFQLIMGLGMGFLYAITFAVLAPLPLSENGPAVAFQVFLRQFSQAWGIAIGGTILQNTLKARLPSAVLSDGIGSNGGQIAYAVIPLISSLPQPLKLQVQEAFSESLKRVWIAFTICNAIGLLSFLAMKNYTLTKKTDGKWGINREQRASPKP